MAKTRVAPKKHKVSKPAGKPAASKRITVWEDDPESGVAVDRDVPDLSRLPLALRIAGKAPTVAKHHRGTREFRYWTAAEAMRRAADFWARHINTWHIGATLPVLLDEGEDLNAYYDRKALNFFHGEGEAGKLVYSGESPDVVSHELGHAVLDAIKPQLWDAASDEAAAFHEAFGDISAILSALQLPTLRAKILTDTKGHLYRNSRLSRLAEQLGSAIRANQPDSVDRDCLRNAVNSFTYTDPLLLPASAPASQLSSEAHSFSRVFSGAAFECIAGMLHVKAKGKQATADQLLAVALEFADILVEAIKQAPVVPNFYAQVAANMVAISAKTSDYGPVLKGAFVRRAILSLHSATHVEALHKAVATAQTKKTFAATSSSENLAVIALSASHYGLGEALFAHSASHNRSYLAQSGKEFDGVWEPPSSSTAARSFIDDLFRRGSVEYNEQVQALGQSRRVKSHQVVKVATGAHMLERVKFDCGFGWRQPEFGSANEKKAETVCRHHGQRKKKFCSSC